MPSRIRCIKHYTTSTQFRFNPGRAAGIGKKFNHHTVNHSVGEYVKTYFVHTNGLENAWSLFKRKIDGIHHWVSGEHLDRYLTEFTFRHNRRKMGEGQRVNALLGQVEGRLTYKELIA